MATFVAINKVTGFANQEPFATPDEERAYFTVANLKKHGFNPPDQRTLDAYAREVIAHGWHMEPFCATVLENGTPVSLGGALDEVWHYLQGFRSHEPCTLVTQTIRAGSLGTKLCSGTVRQVMDWIEDAVESELPEASMDLKIPATATRKTRAASPVPPFARSA